MLQHLVAEHIGWSDRPTLFRVGAPPRSEVDAGWGRRGYTERRFVEASEVSAKLAIAS
jgi:hypothetical protein